MVRSEAAGFAVKADGKSLKLKLSLRAKIKNTIRRLGGAVRLVG